MGNKHNKNENKINNKNSQNNKNNQNSQNNTCNEWIKHKYNILFVGESGIGTKTSLIKRMIEGKFIDIQEEDKEIFRYFHLVKDNKKVNLNLIDTNGKKRNSPPLKNFFMIANCIIMGYDATNKQSFEEIKIYWFNQINKIKSNKLIYLLGNKIDLKDNIQVKDNEVKQFAKLNNIRFFLISVKNDINIKNFINDLDSNLLKYIYNRKIEYINENTYKEYKIVFLGDSGIGSKTSLISRIINGTFDKNCISTSGASFASKFIKLKNKINLKLNLWDTAGQERFRNLHKIFIFDCDCIVLGYDITSDDSFESIKNFWYKYINDFSGVDLIYLIGNKIDLAEFRRVNKDIAQNYAKEKHMRYFEISCESQKGIQEFLDDLANEIVKYD